MYEYRGNRHNIQSFSGRGDDSLYERRNERREDYDASDNRSVRFKKNLDFKFGNSSFLAIDHSKRPDNVAYFWVERKGVDGNRSSDNITQALQSGARFVPKKRHPEIPILTDAVHNLIFRGGENGLTDSAAAAFREEYSRLDDELNRNYICYKNMILLERDIEDDMREKEAILEWHAERYYPYTEEGYNRQKHMFPQKLTISRSDGNKN